MTRAVLVVVFFTVALAACQEEWPQEQRNRCAMDQNPQAYKCGDFR